MHTIIELSTELCHQVNDQFDPVLLEDDNNYNKRLVTTRCVGKSKNLTCGAPPWTALSAEQNRQQNEIVRPSIGRLKHNSLRNTEVSTLQLCDTIGPVLIA